MTLHGWNKTRRAEANLLDDGIDDTSASVATTIVLQQLSRPSAWVQEPVASSRVGDEWDRNADRAATIHYQDLTRLSER